MPAPRRCIVAPVSRGQGRNGHAEQHRNIVHKQPSSISSRDLEQIDDLRALFLDDTPLLDVRAPIEFAEGAFPSAQNHPLIDDSERHRIGIAYADHGPQEAIALGEQLVSGTLKTARIENWSTFLQRHPDAALYCFRGGMRSEISQRWLLEERGIRCPRVRGGYKAMRRFLLEQLEETSQCCRPVVIGGRTGVGKTRLLERCISYIDLEELANHRGSAFGGHTTAQPTQINFENALSIALLKRTQGDNPCFAVEDESRNIGSRHVPKMFFERLEAAPLILLEATNEERVDITLQEYVHDALAEFCVAYGDAHGFQRWADYLRDSTDRIRRRLGGARHTLVRKMLDHAIEQHARQGDIEQHRAWIGFLLSEYYDGMYEYQLSSKADRVLFRGDRAEVLDFLAHKFGVACREPC